MSERSEVREFENTFGDYRVNCDDQPPDAWKQELQIGIRKFLARLEQGLEQETDFKNYSVYTGTSGIALLYLHLAETFDPEQKQILYQKALYFVAGQVQHIKIANHSPSFLIGPAGPISICAVLYHKLGRLSEATELIDRLQTIKRDILDPKQSHPDELLYGRVGYLYALLFLQKHIGTASIDQTIIKEVVEAIIQSGQNLARKELHPCPLMYKWHDKYYLGAAHGICGILYILLQARNHLTSNQLMTIIKPSIEYVITQRFPSGNVPSSLGSNSDKLVQWCHGAPGFINMLALAHQVFHDGKFLEAALDAAQVIWKRGLLRKGYGLCHGTAGNAYGFLVLYQQTEDVQWLYKAKKFAEWCIDCDKHPLRPADRPVSLFEGLAGVIYFLADMLEPKNALFPAFQI